MTGLARCGVDVGGTFTDFVVVGPEGLVVGKRLSTAADPSRAVLAGLEALDPGAVASVAHGTTVATNALLERRGARTAFLVTEGFPDLLALGRGERAELYSFTPSDRPNLVPAELCFEVPERVGAGGEVVRALDEAGCRAVAERVAAAGAESAAVCLLFSFLGPDHERRVGAALGAAAGGPAHVSLSVDVLPEIREYERASTTVVNAYVAPRMAGYLGLLSAAAAPRRLTVMASHGGTLPPGEAARLPAATVLSGPAGGVLGALAVARRAGRDAILSFDMGGTSTDVALCPGEVPYASASRVGGLPVHLPTVDIATVGAGGGSIVRADEGGALRVGPESAGADPGPAAYGRGGRAPTVTDAHVVLGRLPADVPLAGGLRLDRDRARDALAPVAAALGLDVEAVALGALAVVEAAMERALRRVSVERGYAPEAFTLVAFGGAGPLHACALAEALGMSRALVPVAPGALSALGLATAAPTAAVSRSVLRPSGAPPAPVDPVFRELEHRARAVLGGGADIEVTRHADLRYAGQSWELTVPWPRGGDPVAAFAAAHLRRYGTERPGAAVEVVTLRVRATAAAAAQLPPPPPIVAAERRRTVVVLDDGRASGALLAPRASLVPGQGVAGPAVLTQPDATTFVAPGWTAVVGPWGDLELAREAVL